MNVKLKLSLKFRFRWSRKFGRLTIQILNKFWWLIVLVINSLVDYYC